MNLENTLELVSVPTIQVSNINPTTPFRVSNPPTTKTPFAPMVTAEGALGSTTITVKMVVLIDSNNVTTPTVFSATEAGTVLNIQVNYTVTEAIPLSFEAWYIEFIYTSATVPNLLTTCTTLNDTDPVTSRGTVTTIQHIK